MNFSFFHFLLSYEKRLFHSQDANGTGAVLKVIRKRAAYFPLWYGLGSYLPSNMMLSK